MKSIFKQFSLKKKNQKNKHKLLVPRHIFTHGFFYTKDTEFFLHSAKQLIQFFFFKFLCHYKIKCEHKTQGESPSLQSYTDVLSCEDSLSLLGGAGEGGHPARDTSEHTQPHPPKTVAGTQNSAKPTDFPSENQSTR